MINDGCGVDGHRMKPRFGVILPVGPGAGEIERVADTVQALEAHEPGKFHLLIADDAMPGRDFFKAIPTLPQGRTTIMANPRRGRGFGWEGACTPAVIAGLKRFVSVDVDFVLKMDTDALPIAPFSSRIASKFAEDASVGMLGSRYYADGTEPDREWVHGVGLGLEKLLRPFALWRMTRLRKFPDVQIALWGDYRRIRNTIRQAFINGYRVGDHCQGGAYALSRNCLKELDLQGHLDHPCTWLRTPVPADDVQALCIKAAGLHYRDFSGVGEPFACHWRGLPDTPENLLKRRAAIIHSIKDHGGRTEAETRAFFKNLRASSSSHDTVAMRAARS